MLFILARRMNVPRGGFCTSHLETASKICKTKYKLLVT